uniref:Orf110d n=1 Tax=Batis maritima TaxID=4436 RepID=A0A068BED8_BATMA|nr:orf110d [Batis maritima]AIC83421.1 orf110d [Batis maritima]
MPHGQKNEMATRLVSNFVLLSLGSGNGTLQQEERTTKVEDRLVASPESDSLAYTTDLPSSPFPYARGTESSLLITELAAAEDTTSVTDSVDGRENLFHRVGCRKVCYRLR